MKRKIRNNIFETNSSSIHTLAFSGKLEPSNLKSYNGYTYAHYGEFGKEYMRYFDQQTKLDYLVSYLYCILKYPSREGMYDSYEFGSLQEVICKYTGTKGLRIAKSPAEPSIDHQSQPYDYGGFISEKMYYDKEFIKNFVFNPQIGFQTDCD